MKGRLRIASKKLSAIALSCLMLFTTVAPMMQTSAADSVKGLETNVDRTALDKAVADARNAGVPVTKGQDQDKGVAHSKAEIDAKIAEIKADYQQQIQKLEEAKKAIAKCDEEQKAYEAAKRDYEEKLNQYNIAKKVYDEDMVKYEKAMEELEKKKHTDGYLEEPYPQTLLFKTEPDARPSVNTKTYRSTDWVKAVEQMGYPAGSEIYNIALKYNRFSLDEGAFRVFLEKDKTVTAYYSNLQNSYFNGKKIIRVEYKYTLKKLTGGQTKIPAILYFEPTKTINYSDLGGTAEIDMEVVFYGEDNQPIDMTGGLISFASLNRDNEKGVDMSEYVKNFNGRFLQIHGSSIRESGNTAISSTKSNEHVKNGSRFEVGAWDTPNSPNKWYGAIVGRCIEKTVKVTFGANNRKAIWFAFNSDIKAFGVPIKPVEPEKPTPPEEPQCPNIQASYHYDRLFYQPGLEKKVSDQNNTDINNQTVAKNSIVKFSLNVDGFPAGRERIESLVFNDSLPSGYEVDLEATRQASPDYDVNYDAGTNKMVFSAKTGVVQAVNADLSKDATVPAPIIVGKVTKAGTTYRNDFDLTIDNKFTVKSNPVEVNTPPEPTQPKKEVFTGGTTTKIDGKVVQPGQQLTYAITYKNTTGKDVKATITDKIPAHTTFVSAENGGTLNGDVISWTVDVAKNQSITVKFTVEVNRDINGAPVDNKARVNDGTNDYDTNQTHNPTPTEPKKDVFTGSDTTSIDGKVVQPGQELRYELTYTNTTGTKQTVTFTDKIPEYTTFVSAENNGSYDAQSKVITWTQEVEAGKTATVSFKVKVNDDVNGNPVDNQGHVKDGVNESDTNKTHNPTPTEPKKDVFTGTDTTSIDGKVVAPGQELRYELTYTNTTGEKQTVTFTDKIPAYTTFVSAENNGSYDAQSKVITWTQEVEAGKTATVSFKVKVNDDVNGNPVDNQGHVKDGVNESDTNKTHNPTPTEPKKDVFTGSDTTSIDGKVVQPGQELRYELTYTNTTGSKQTVTFTDKIPEYTTFVSAENNGSYDAQSKVITWTQEVEAGKTATVSFKVKVNDDVNGNPVDNQGHVKDGVNESDTNKTHNPTPTEPKKDVFTGTDTTSIDGKVVQPGQELRYELTYTNTTGTKQTVTFTDKIPQYTTFVSAEDGGQESGGTITWTKEVENGQTVTVSFKVKVNDDVNGNPVDNQGHVKDGVNESDTNKTHNPTPTEPKKDVFTGSDTTSIDGKVVQPGQELRYELTYTNTTGSKQTVTFTDKIPQYTTFVSAEDGGQESGGTITWTKEVENGATVTVSFKVKVNDDVNGNPVDNQGHVKDGVNESDTNKTHNPTPTEPKKDVFTGTDTTSIDGKVVQPGQELRYELTYTNTTGTKQTVTFTDKIPQYTTFVSAEDGGQEAGGTITWTKEVENGQTVTVSFKVKVNDDVNGNPVDNQGHVKDGVNESDTNKTHNPTPTEPKKDVFTGTDTTSIDGKVVVPGQELRYELTYTNTTGSKQTVTFTDKIPQYTTFVSAEDGGQEAGGTITWTKEVENGQTVTVSFKVKVNDDVNGNPVDNQGHVKDGVNESDTNKTHNPTPTEPKKDVFTGTDTTSIDGKVVQPGQELRYELTYTNTTGSKQTVTFTDKIPQYTTFVSAEDGGQESGGTITWTKEVENGQTVTVSFKVKVNDDVNGNSVDNQGHVKDGVNESDTNKTHNPTPTEPKKDVFTGTDTTSIDGKVVAPGQELRYELTYTNTTGAKQTVTFTDKIPQYTSFVSADNDGVNDNGTITWTKEVENGQTVTVSFKVKVNDDVNGNPVDNQGHVKDGVNESDTNKTHNPTPTEPKKDVFTGTDTTSIDGKVVAPGQELRYELTYTNTTGSKQTVTFTDKIPQYTSFVSADNDGVNDNGTITWTKEVENGATVTVSFKVKVNDDVNGNPVDNQGHVKDGVNESDTNKTHNPTPTEPKKDVFTGSDTTSIDGKVVQPGQELRYELTYTNTTGSKQTVTFTDKIPQYTTFVSAEDGGQESGGTITWTKEVENGQTVTVSFKVKVNDDVNGNPVDNQGHVKDGVNESDTNKTHNPTPTEPKKDVFTGSDTTSIDGKVVQPGQELRYELTYTNTTGSKQTVTFTDKIPQYTTFVSAEDGGQESGGTITWTKEVENGATVTVSFKVKVNDDVNGNPVDNQGHVKDGVNESDTNKTHNPTPTEPKKDVFTGTDTTSIDGKVVAPGQELRYELTYTNTTGSKQTVTFTDKIPQYTSFVSADNDGVNDNGTITWTKEVENGATVTVSFKVKVNDDVNGNPVDNQGHVKDGVNESDTNKTHNPTPTEPKKDVFTGTDTISIDGKVVAPGQELRYELTYTNTTGTKQTVTFTDKIPQYTTFVSAEDGGQESGGTITWTKEVENGATVTVSFKVKVNDDVNGNPVDNQGHVKDGVNESDTNKTHNPTPTEPKKDVFTGTDTTSIDGKVVAPGQELRYELTYTNTTGEKQTVTFTDKIPQYTSFVSADNDGVNDNGTITWTKEVENGATVTVSFKVKVNDDVNGNPVDNQGHVKDGVNESDTNKTHNPTPTEPKKDVFTGSDTTSIDGKVVQPGQELRYELTYTNTTGSKQTVTFTDKIPQYTSFVSADNDGVNDNGTITWTKEVENGATVTVSFKVKVNDDVNGNPVDNQGHVKDGVNESDTNKTHNPTPHKPDKPNEPENPTPHNPGKPGLQKPKTSDSGNLPLMMFLLISSSGVLAGALVKKRKKQA